MKQPPQKKLFREPKAQMQHHYVFQRGVGMRCSKCGCRMADGKEHCTK